MQADPPPGESMTFCVHVHAPSCTWKCFVVTNNMWCLHVCVCYLYCGYKNPCVVTLGIFLTHIWTQWQNPVSWVCKANVAHRLTSVKNDTIHSLYSRCTIKHSWKGEALDKCMSVSLQSPLRGCRMRAMTLQYNLRLSAEEPMKKLLLCCSFFFFPPPRRVVSLLTW